MTRGVGHPALVSENLNSRADIDLLKNTMTPSTHGLCVTDNFIFQQENTRCHTSRETVVWFEENNNTVMTCQPKVLI